MKAWLVVLERRGVFIWPLRGLVHLFVVMIVCGAFVRSMDVPALGWTFGILGGLMMATVTAYAHGFALIILYALQQVAQETLDSMRRDVRDLETADTSDKRGALTMKDEP